MGEKEVIIGKKNLKLRKVKDYQDLSGKKQ